MLAGFPGEWAVVAEPADVHDDPQVRANGHVAAVDTGGGASLPMVTSPVQSDGTPGAPGRAPETSEHTEEVLLRGAERQAPQGLAGPRQPRRRCLVAEPDGAVQLVGDAEHHLGLQKMGRALNMRVPGWRANTRAWSQHCSAGDRWAWSTPLGALVVPEEKMTSAGSSGVRAAARASSRSPGRGSPAAGRWSHEGSPSTATRRTKGRSAAMAATSSPKRRASSRLWVSITAACDVSTRWAGSGAGENVDMGTATAPARVAPPSKVVIGPDLRPSPV